MKIETQCLHEGYTPQNGQPLTLPIYQSTTYKYESTAQVAKLFDLTPRQAAEKLATDR